MRASTARLPSTVADSQPVVTTTRDQPGNLSRYSRSTVFGENAGV